MREYQCHKRVKAAKIKAITKDDSVLERWVMEFEDNERFGVTDDWVKKHNPEPGGYFVIYDDEYRSYSPRKAFEEGYTEIAATGRKP